ncbi:hypothetical protein BHE74_00011591 [Ensete ventricosum]|nr:hypothetical protein BHE74_00011591 [Ensete ventricosum]
MSISSNTLFTLLSVTHGRLPPFAIDPRTITLLIGGLPMSGVPAGATFIGALQANDHQSTLHLLVGGLARALPLLTAGLPVGILLTGIAFVGKRLLHSLARISPLRR